MKKVININFQGRVIPIEETAFEELKKYTDSLRRHFEREEGRDEIINDIENRIAELFSERLKKEQSGCITDNDLNEIIKGIGRPEDFDSQEEMSGSSSYSSDQESGRPSMATPNTNTEPRGSWSRNANDKILGGVCSGLAHYLKVDPTIVRILFALITLGGFGTGILLYIILWVVLPARSLQFNIRRRLYRNPDQKVIGGVCSGLSSYFNIPVWVPRIIFAMPILLGIFGNVFDHDFHNILFGSFGGTLLAAYIILWMVIPFASTASEKLEMRGEKIDLESIKNTVQGEMKDLKVRADKMGADLKVKAEAWSEEVKERGQALGKEAAPIMKNTGNGIGHAIGVLFKAFFLFIAGIIIVALFVALMALIFSGVGLAPLRNFVLSGFWQHAFAWGTLFLFLAVPLIGLMVWLIRRITGARSSNRYLPYTFGSLWVLGWISLIGLAVSISNDFRRTGSIREEVSINQPTTGRLQLAVNDTVGHYYKITWFDDEDDHLPALSSTEDTMLLNTIRIKIRRSKDSSYHMYMLRLARGNSPIEAERTASHINFPVTQVDSIIYLPRGFTFPMQSKFRNQQVAVVMEIPDNKMIRVDHEVDRFGWFDIKSTPAGIQITTDNDGWDNHFDWKTDVWYRMTINGLESLEKDKEWDNDKSGRDEEKNYRYHKGDSVNIHIDRTDSSVNIKLKASMDKSANGSDGSEDGEESGDGTNDSGVPATKINTMISVLDLLKLGS